MWCCQWGEAVATSIMYHKCILNLNNLRSIAVDYYYIHYYELGMISATMNEWSFQRTYEAIQSNARDWLQTTVGLQKCDICQITSNNILPARVFWESNQTRIADLLSVIHTVNIRAVLPSWARIPRWRFHLLSRMPLGFCLFGLSAQGGYRARFLGLFYDMDRITLRSKAWPRYMSLVWMTGCCWNAAIWILVQRTFNELDFHDLPVMLF